MFVICNMNLVTFENVKYDSNSEFSWDKLNESEFVQDTLDHLRRLMGNDFKNYIFFIFSNNNSGRIPESLYHITTQKKVLLYISDEIGTDPSEYSDSYFAIFKAYIGVGSFSANVFPFPLGCVNGVPSFNVAPTAQRKYNFFFRGNLNTNRVDFYRSFSNFSFLAPSKNMLSHKYYIKFLLWFQRDFSNFFPRSIIFFNKSFKGGFSLFEYGEILAQSKIVLSPKGFNSTECFRLYEAMRAGCIIISERLPSVVFYKDSPIIQISNWKDGLKIAKELLKDADKLKQIQKKTLDWWETVCSEKGTASYMFDKLRGLE